MNIPMHRKLEASEFIFLAVAIRESAEKGKGKKGCEQESDVWGEIKRKLRKGKIVARGPRE